MSEPSYFLVNDSERPLSARELIALIGAVHARGLPFRFKATGGSMWPFIKDSDVITVASLTGRPRLGDVVAFLARDKTQLVVHRVVELLEGSCAIRGDNSGCGDGIIQMTSILGKVAAIEREGRRISFGLGRERRIIAFLSRNSMLCGLMFAIRTIIEPVYRYYGKRLP